MLSKATETFVMAAVWTCFLSGPAGATPSSTVWTVATTDIQAHKVLHPGIDNYFTVFRRARDGSGDLPTDVGFTVGVLPFQQVQMEIGVDLVEPTDDPVFFNAKLGTPEGTLFHGSPAFSAGIFNVGTKAGSTDQNVFHAEAGKSVRGLGRLFAGFYAGNGDVLVDAQGNPEKSGAMLGFDRGLLPVNRGTEGEFNRLVVAADYASGRNTLGGGGVGLYYYFSRSVAVLTGPVFFNEETINGKWKWTTQLDMNLPL